MFEKESQDYAIREVAPRRELYIKGRADIDADYEKVKKIWQDGAEFGYNKGFEFGVKSNEKVNQIVDNEWHYVKDGKYPKENQLVMVYRMNPLGANIAITNWYDSYKDTKVIAWKEIVLPELKE